MSKSECEQIEVLSLISGKIFASEEPEFSCDRRQLDVVALSPDGVQIAVVSDNMLWLGHIDMEEERLTMSCLSSSNLTYDLAFSPIGERLATDHLNHLVEFWAAETGAEIRTLFGHSETVSAVTFSSCGDILGSG